MTGSVSRIRRLLRHRDAMQRSLDLGDSCVRRRRRRRLRRRMAKLDRRIHTIMDSVHETAVHCLLRHAKQRKAKVVILMSPLDLGEMGRRRDGSVIGPGTRRMLKALRHADFIKRLERAVAGLDNAVLRLDASEGTNFTMLRCSLAALLFRVGCHLTQLHSNNSVFNGSMPVLRINPTPRWLQDHQVRRGGLPIGGLANGS